MKDIKAYELDLQMILEAWQMSLIDLDFVGDISLDILKDKLIHLFDTYQEYGDSDLQSMFENDSNGG